MFVKMEVLEDEDEDDLQTSNEEFSQDKEGEAVKSKPETKMTYIYMRGDLIKEKRPQPPCSSCYFRCSQKIDSHVRNLLCNTFWGLKDIKKQRDYLVSRIKRSQSKISKVAPSRRRLSMSYTLIHNGQIYKVCKKFFLSTLDVSEKMVRTAFKKSDAVYWTS